MKTFNYIPGAVPPSTDGGSKTMATNSPIGDVFGSWIGPLIACLYVFKNLKNEKKYEPKNL